MNKSIRATVLVATLSAFCLGACGASGGDNTQSDGLELSDAEMINSGREVVEAQCQTCHATGATDQSPRPDAPPLRTVLSTYDPEALATDFREHIHVGHPDMPDFDFGPIGTDHVLAYLKSIQIEPGDTE